MARWEKVLLAGLYAIWLTALGSWLVGVLPTGETGLLPAAVAIMNKTTGIMMERCAASLFLAWLTFGFATVILGVMWNKWEIVAIVVYGLVFLGAEVAAIIFAPGPLFVLFFMAATVMANALPVIIILGTIWRKVTGRPPRALFSALLN